MEQKMREAGVGGGVGVGRPVHAVERRRRRNAVLKPRRQQRPFNAEILNYLCN